MPGMATASDKPPAIVRSMRFDDMDTMAQAMIGDHVEFVPLRSGPFHGRWHLGRFARDYAAMFREMPSDTIGKDRHGADSVTG
jgi:hypothetical protein